MSSKDPRQLLAAAIGHHQAGRLAEAEALYRDILAFAPDHVDSLHLLGVIATQRGQYRDAIGLIDRAIAVKKTPAAEFHSNIGLAYRGLGQQGDAIRHFERALALKPDYAEAHNNLAAALRDGGRFDAAEPHCRRVVALRPGSASAHFALGAVLQDQGRFADAVAAYEEAVRLRPGYPQAYNNLGVIRLEQGELDAAIAALELVLRLKADYAEAEYNLGTAYQEQGRFTEALARYERAQMLKPDYANAHWNEALLRLTLGEFHRGWEKYEWRWRRSAYSPRPFTQPEWDGGDLTGSTILLHAEQGFGDTIQFIRYANLVKGKGASAIIAECQPGLAGLLASVAGIDRIVTRGEGVLPPFDCHAPLLGLPRRLGTRLETIPAGIPYLHAESDLVKTWRARLGAAPGLNIGLAWRGNPNNSQDRRRSIAADSIARLCGIPGISWVSLQADARPDELETLSRHGAIRDFGPWLKDWSETAALVSCLDLVLSVDTAVAHLAGALGKPSWVLLSFVAHWCWLAERSDSPWYPSARLFRQTNRGDWDGVLSRVAEELGRLK